MEDYRNEEEKKYFDSDFNKFVSLNCPRTVTIMNIDLLIFKRDKSLFWFIEYKHSKESMKYGQEEALRELALLFKDSLKYDVIKKLGYKLGVFIVRSDPPFFDSAVVEDLINNKKYILNKNQLIDWLNFKLDLKDTIKEGTEENQK